MHGVAVEARKHFASMHGIPRQLEHARHLAVEVRRDVGGTLFIHHDLAGNSQGRHDLARLNRGNGDSGHTLRPRRNLDAVRIRRARRSTVGLVRGGRFHTAGVRSAGTAGGCRDKQGEQNKLGTLHGCSP
jgi:hypothetical protein